MAYRDDLLALGARRDALAGELEQKTTELNAAASLYAEASAYARLPVLDNIRIAAPCSAEWDAMSGDERTRHCGSCKQSVYNLSDLTRAEAEALVREKNGHLCVRYYQRKDGTILLADCSVGVGKRRRKTRVIAAGAAALLATAGGGSLAQRSQALRNPSPALTAHAEVTMGAVGIAAPPPPAPLAPPVLADEYTDRVAKMGTAAFVNPPPRHPPPHVRPHHVPPPKRTP